MKHLIIIGARGWGREVYALSKYCKGYQTEFDVRGFLDDKYDALEGRQGYPPIIGSVEDYSPLSDDVFVCALGDNKWRKYYADIMLNKGGIFINLIHRSAYLGQNTTLGYGCVISHEVSISCDITIGNFVNFQRFVDIGHDAKIGNYCSLGNKCFVGGGAIIGDNATIQTGAIVLPHINVGNNATVGAGAIVIKKVKEGNTVYGNPAKVLKY
jgi:sugar O-acyltransferase (sialic acid O-acetyltransferase NeuD family)